MCLWERPCPRSSLCAVFVLTQAYPEYLITYQIVKPESPAQPPAAAEQKSWVSRPRLLHTAQTVTHSTTHTFWPPAHPRLSPASRLPDLPVSHLAYTCSVSVFKQPSPSLMWFTQVRGHRSEHWGLKWSRTSDLIAIAFCSFMTGLIQYTFLFHFFVSLHWNVLRELF